MSFGKLVGGIVVANIITGLLFWAIDSIYFDHLISQQPTAAQSVAGQAPMNEEELNALANQATADAKNAEDAATAAHQADR